MGLLAIAEGAAILSHSLGTEVECPHCGKAIPAGSSECPYCNKSLEAIQQVPVEEGGVQVSHTTKHKSFIQVSDDADNIQFEKIIDENTPLPCEENRKFYTLVENQKIVGVKLFSDAENDKKNCIDTNYNGTKYIATAAAEDETMNVRVRVPATGKTTNVVLSRGALDTHCLEAVAPTFDRVMNDPSISESKKADFVEKLQKVIDTISSCNYTPESSKWQELEDNLKSASQVATTKEENEPVQMIIAQIQLENFGRFIREEDKVAMRRELDRAEKASTPMEKNDAVNKLDELTEKYSLFTHGFLLNIAGHDDSDPVRANKALVAFNQFMAALNEGNVQRARDILSANEHLIGNINLPTTGGTTGIGRE